MALDRTVAELKVIIESLPSSLKPEVDFDFPDLPKADWATMREWYSQRTHVENQIEGLEYDHRRVVAYEIIYDTIEELYRQYGMFSYPGGDFSRYLEERAYDIRMREKGPAKPQYIKRKIHPSTRKRIFERDAYRCAHCSGWENLTIDHIIPESKNGGDEDENLQTLCARCNSSKGNRTP